MSTSTEVAPTWRRTRIIGRLVTVEGAELTDRPGTCAACLQVFKEHTDAQLQACGAQYETTQPDGLLDDDPPPPSTKPTRSGAFRAGMAARKEGKGLGENPHARPGGDVTAAKEWARGHVAQAGQAEDRR